MGVSTKYGFDSVNSGLNVKNNFGINNAMNQTGMISAGRVTSIILNSDSDTYDPAQIGNIEYVDYSESPRDVSTVEQNVIKKIAKPLFPNVKNYPIVSEIVMILQLPDIGIKSTTASKSVYYISGINMWNHPHHNAVPFSEGNSAPSQQKNYTQVELGSPRVVTNQPTEVFLGATFRERDDINPLEPFEGDVIYEGRWGNSMRFGSTVQNRPNTWSSTGTNGDPIVIIRNGQGENVGNGFSHVVEDINLDKGSIYLTSTQKIPLQVSSKGYNSYKTQKPETPDTYTGNQIMISSGRLVFNSNKDHILLSSAKSINLNAIEGINIDTNSNVVIASKNMYLGGPSANEPLLLGNRTEKLLSDLINNLQQFAQVCSVTYSPDGHLAGFNAIATQLSTSLTALSSTLSNIKSQSNFTV
jgi:hypothetical protein